MKSISSGTDTSRRTNDEGTEKNEEIVDLNSSKEKIALLMLFSKA